jgi:hypothetical protein
VQAHESDCGLDMLAVADEKYLRGVKYKTFHVRHVTELLRAYIIGEFAKERYLWNTEYVDGFYEYTLPYTFSQVVMLVAEYR